MAHAISVSSFFCDDYLYNFIMMFKAFFKAVINGKEMPVDVYDAASWMSVTALSSASIAAGGTVQTFPDFTRGKWVTRKPYPVFDLPGYKKDRND